MNSLILYTLPKDYLSWGSDRIFASIDDDSGETHVVPESPELHSSATENGEEEYIEINYAEEIEDCSRYTFSQGSYCCTRSIDRHLDLPRDMDSDACGISGLRDEDQWLMEQKRYYLAERAESQQRWVRELQRQQEDFIQKHSRARVMIVVTEARRQNLAWLRSTNSTPKELEEAEQRWHTLASRISAEMENLAPRECRDMLSAVSLFKSPGEWAAPAPDTRGRRERILEKLREQQQLFCSPDAPDEAAEVFSEEVTESVLAMESPPLANADTPLDVPVVLPLAFSLFDVTGNKSSDAHELAGVISPNSTGGASSSDSGSDGMDFADECYSPPLFPVDAMARPAQDTQFESLPFSLHSIFTSA